MGYHCFSRMRLRCRQPHRKMGGRLETRFQGRCGRTPRVLRGLLQVTRPAVVIRHLGWPHANQNRPLPGHKVTFFDRRGITKKNPASEATRAGLSPVIRDPYASRYRPPAEQIGRSPRRLSRGETRGRPVSVRLIRSHVRVCIRLLTPRDFCKTVHSLSAQHRAARVGRGGLDEGARTAGVAAALNKGTPIASGICGRSTLNWCRRARIQPAKFTHGERVSTESRSRSAILGLRWGHPGHP